MRKAKEKKLQSEKKHWNFNISIATPSTFEKLKEKKKTQTKTAPKEMKYFDLISWMSLKCFNTVQY